MTDLLKLRHFSTAIFSETKSVTPIFFFIFGVSTLSTNSRREMKKISPWEDFGANVLNTGIYIFFGGQNRVSTFTSYRPFSKVLFKNHETSNVGVVCI